MKTAKKSWKPLMSGLFGVLIIASVCLSCKNAVANGGGSSDDGTGDDVVLISYTAEQVGGESDLVTSTGIKLTFTEGVSDLTEDQITIGDSITKGSLSRDGNIWTIEISGVTAEGEVSISIENAAIEKTEKQVRLYKVNSDDLPKLVSADLKDKTTLTLEFSKPVTDANSSCFIVSKTIGSETFAVSNALIDAIDKHVVTLTVANVSSARLGGLTITISDNAVKDLLGNGVEADAVGVPAPVEFFKFTVRTGGSGESFAIPTSGYLNGAATVKSYNWAINWGDDNGYTPVTGNSSATSEGISHTYLAAGDYQITIAANDSLDAWFGAFGFAENNNGANIQTNRDKIISVDSEITLFMTRTQAQIDGSQSPTYEWAYTLMKCQNPAFKMGENFNFAEEWDAITAVGDYFAYSTFRNCSKDGFTMNDVFNLPKNITTVGVAFAAAMFKECSGDGFTMNGVFNIPQGITTSVTYFISEMFSGCKGANFILNDIIKFPVTTGLSLFAITFSLGSGAAHQTRTAASIINGNPTPAGGRATFGPSTAWSDYNEIDQKWRAAD